MVRQSLHSPPPQEKKPNSGSAQHKKEYVERVSLDISLL